MDSDSEEETRKMDLRQKGRGLNEVLGMKATIARPVIRIGIN